MGDGGEGEGEALQPRRYRNYISLTPAVGEITGRGSRESRAPVRISRAPLIRLDGSPFRARRWLAEGGGGGEGQR